MAAVNRLPLRAFLALTVLPALLIGAVLWYLSGLLPDCTITEGGRQTSPDGRYDLVIFSRSCGTTGPNTQAALIPAGDDLPEDAASFLSIGITADIAPRWDGYGNIELAMPPGAPIYRQDDTVADIDVIYR